MTKEEAKLAMLKRNLMRLCAQHKETCPGKECTVSLMMVGEVMMRAGIPLNEDDIRALL